MYAVLPMDALTFPAVPGVDDEGSTILGSSLPKEEEGSRKEEAEEPERCKSSTGVLNDADGEKPLRGGGWGSVK